MLSIFTTYTNPDKRMDPWKEALECYQDFADEVVVTGENWKDEFTWREIGETFQEGFDLAKGDWVIRMDIDYFLNEKHKEKLYAALNKSIDFPAIALPQYQFFSTDRYHLKTRLCIVLNKKYFPDIKLNGGGDFCLATINNKLITPESVPNFNIPIYQYDSMFRDKKVISQDRARFARAWFREFGNYGVRGGPEESKAFDAWFNEIQNKYSEHTHKMKFEKHPKYIQKKLQHLTIDQFGYNMFELKNEYQSTTKKVLKGKKDKYLGHYINNLSVSKNDY